MERTVQLPNKVYNQYSASYPLDKSLAINVRRYRWIHNAAMTLAILACCAAVVFGMMYFRDALGTLKGFLGLVGTFVLFIAAYVATDEYANRRFFNPPLVAAMGFYNENPDEFPAEVMQYVHDTLHNEGAKRRRIDTPCTVAFWAEHTEVFTAMVIKAALRARYGEWFIGTHDWADGRLQNAIEDWRWDRARRAFRAKLWAGCKGLIRRKAN